MLALCIPYIFLAGTSSMTRKGTQAQQSLSRLSFASFGTSMCGGPSAAHSASGICYRWVWFRSLKFWFCLFRILIDWYSLFRFSSKIFFCGAGTSRKYDCRIGTVGHDTQLCLWDVTDDLLKVPSHICNSYWIYLSQANTVCPRHRNSTVVAPVSDAQVV